jgi:hypothetical protein
MQTESNTTNNDGRINYTEDDVFKVSFKDAIYIYL